MVFAMLTTTTATNKQTGNRITIKSADLYGIENGRIVEHLDVVESSRLPDRKISEL